MASGDQPDNPEEKARRKKIMTSFFSKGHKSVKQKRDANKKLMTKSPRAASRKHVLRLDRYVHLYHKNGGLEQFQNRDKLTAFDLLQGALTGKFPVGDKPEIPDSLRIECFVQCTDQEQSQITGGEFMLSPPEEGLDVCGVRFIDDFHRLHNDVVMACAKSGFAPIIKAGTLICNIAYGPWQSSAYYHKICAEADHLPRQLSPNCRLVLKLWPSREAELDRWSSVTSGRATGEAARVEWLETLPEQQVMGLRGLKVSPSKWLSFQKAFKPLNKNLSSRSLTLAALCMAENWIQTEEDLFGGSRCGIIAGDKPELKSKRQAFMSANQKLEHLKARMANNVAAAAKAACDIDVLNGIRILCMVTDPCLRELDDLTKKLTSPELCLKHHQNWAQHGWMQTLKDVAVCLTNARELPTCGIICEFQTEELALLDAAGPEIAYQNALCKSMGILADTVISIRAGSLAERSFYYPGRLANLTSPDPTIVNSTLAEFRLDVEAYWAAKECCHSNFGDKPEACAITSFGS